MENVMPTNDNLSNMHHLTWRDKRYQHFYQIVDQLLEEIQDHTWIGTGKKKRRVRNADLAKLTYSVECIIRDCMSVVYGRERVGETAIYRGQYHYGSKPITSYYLSGMKIPAPMPVCFVPSL